MSSAQGGIIDEMIEGIAVPACSVLDCELTQYEECVQVIFVISCVRGGFLMMEKRDRPCA
jgi:hypothetical protein